jgi:hypothetical protein
MLFIYKMVRKPRSGKSKERARKLDKKKTDVDTVLPTINRDPIYSETEAQSYLGTEVMMGIPYATPESVVYKSDNTSI